VNENFFELCEIFGVPPEVLPEVRDSVSDLGPGVTALVGGGSATQYDFDQAIESDLHLNAPVALVAHRSVRGTLQWTLPKGAQEPGETVADTAMREVREETGLEVELIGPLDTIDYWFVWAPEQTRYHKFVHYFLMRAVGGDFARHDAEMEEADWFTLEQARRRMAFANERKLLDLIPAALGRQGASGRSPGRSA